MIDKDLTDKTDKTSDDDVIPFCSVLEVFGVVVVLFLGEIETGVLPQIRQKISRANVLRPFCFPGNRSPNGSDKKEGEGNGMCNKNDNFFSLPKANKHKEHRCSPACSFF